MWKQFKEYLQNQDTLVYEEENTGFILYTINNERCFLKEVYVFPEARLRTKSFWEKFVLKIKEENKKVRIVGATVYVPKKDLNVLRTTLKLGFNIIAAENNCISLTKEI